MTDRRALSIADAALDAAGLRAVRRLIAWAWTSHGLTSWECAPVGWAAP